MPTPNNPTRISNALVALLALCGAFAAPARAQVEFGTVLPPDCARGQLFAKTDATRGSNLYVCIGREWVQQSGAGASSGDVSGPSSSVDSEVALFSGTGGKTIKRAAVSGIPKLTSGVLAAASAGTDYSPAISSTVPSITANAGTGALSTTSGYVTDIQVATVTVTSAEILGLSTTNTKTLIAAPGANKMLFILAISVEYDFVSAAYTTTNGALGYLNGSALFQTTSLVCADGGTQLLTRTSDAACIMPGAGSNGALKSTFNFVNKAFVLGVSSGTPAAGDGTLTVTIIYRVVPTALG